MIVNINKEFAIRCQRKRISYNGFPEYPICNILIINVIILLKIE